MEAAEESGSATSERDATVVVMNLARLHDLIDDRRANAVQAARQLFAQEQVPATAILSNGTIQVSTYTSYLRSVVVNCRKALAHATQSSGDCDECDYLRRNCLSWRVYPDWF